MRNPITVFDRYNTIASFRGYLPIGIGPHSDARTLRDAADKIEWLNLDVSRELLRLAATIQPTEIAHGIVEFPNGTFRCNI